MVQLPHPTGCHLPTQHGGCQYLALPTAVAQLSDQGTQLYTTAYNPQGRPTRSIDPLGRDTRYTYAANGVDLIKVEQFRDGSFETIFQANYNAQHRPLSITNASGQTSNFTYNGFGQMLSSTNALGEITTMDYDAQGYLTRVTRPENSVTLMEWNQGQPSRITNPEGLVLNFSYDGLDRLTRTTWPDGTTQENTYNALSLTQSKDRENRITTREYNAIRELVRQTDPLGRVTLYEWCRCGSLQQLTDAEGRITRWSYDAAGRLLSKTYPDNSQDLYSYDNIGRLIRVQDALGRTKNYAHAKDNRLLNISYTGDNNLTPNVSFSYDSAYARLLSMTDGTGTTTYSYHPVGVPGALQPSSLSKAGLGGFASFTTTHTYDELGRVTNKAIDGVEQSVSYDELGRAASWQNPLGSFSAQFVPGTGKPTQINYPNGQVTRYSYYDAQNDFRLLGIENKAGDDSLLSAFGYAYTPTGNITRWAQQLGGLPLRDYQLGYDAADQLTSSVLAAPVSGQPNSKGYLYTPAGNRSSEVINGVPINAGHNNLNQIISKGSGAGAPPPQPDPSIHPEQPAGVTPIKISPVPQGGQGWSMTDSQRRFEIHSPAGKQRRG
ncbi:MAG: RHS repeat protein [Blastochloris sp.]|nr:RHS repeat protein [Blastochloris sp.]